MVSKDSAFDKYKKSVTMSNKEIAIKLDNPFKLKGTRDRDLSQLFNRVVERVNKNYRKSNQTIVEQINSVTSFNINRFNKLLTTNVEFIPNKEEVRILEWLLCNDINDFTEDLKIKYEK